MRSPQLRGLKAARSSWQLTGRRRKTTESCLQIVETTQGYFFLELLTLHAVGEIICHRTGTVSDCHIVIVKNAACHACKNIPLESDTAVLPVTSLDRLDAALQSEVAIGLFSAEKGLLCGNVVHGLVTSGVSPNMSRK